MKVPLLAMTLPLIALSANANEIRFEKSYYARTTPNFDKDERKKFWKGQPSNILGLLKAGTTADFIGFERTSGGDLAVKVRIKEGKLSGKEALVYFGPEGSTPRGIKLPCTDGPCARPDPIVRKTEEIAQVLEAVRPSTPMDVDWGRSRNSNELSQVTTNALSKYGQSLLKSVPSDVGTFCPSYSKLNQDQRAGFWMQLASGIMRFESGYKPDEWFAERDFKNPDMVTKKPVASEGLFQLSYQDELSYRNRVPGACDFDHKADARFPKRDRRRSIQDPERNANCGIAILSYWISRDGRISGRTAGWRGGSRYWAVLRNQKRKSQIQTLTRAYCAKSTR